MTDAVLLAINCTNADQFSSSLSPIGIQNKTVGNILTALLTTVSAYILMSLILFEIRQNRITSINVNKLQLLSSASALLSCLSEQFELRLGTKDDVWCTLYKTFIAVFYCLGSLSAYTLLWAQQRSFYADPLLKNFSSKLLRCTSATVIVGVYVSLIPVALIFTLSYDLRSTPDGCIMFLEKENSTVAAGALLFMAASYVIFQLLLLVLVTYPLMRSAGTNQLCFYSVQQYELSAEIRTLITRLCLCTAACVASVTIGSAIAAYNFLQAPDSYWSLLLHADLIVNAVAVVCTTANWRERLFPCVASRKPLVLPDEMQTSFEGL